MSERFLITQTQCTPLSPLIYRHLSLPGRGLNMQCPTKPFANPPLSPHRIKNKCTGMGSILDTVSKNTKEKTLSSILDTFSANFYEWHLYLKYLKYTKKIQPLVYLYLRYISKVSSPTLQV